MADIKELKKLVAFMRKTGVIEYKSGEIELKLSPEAPTTRKYTKKQDVTEAVNEVDTDSPSDEDLLFWSVPQPSGGN